jgi:hypothetical protein
LRECPQERPKERPKKRPKEHPKEHPKERQVVGLLSEREALMSEIALRARFGLLPVARMLVVLGAAQPALKPGGTEAPSRRRTARPGPLPGSRGSSQKIAG